MKERTQEYIANLILEKPRLGAEGYTHIIQQAQQNNLQAYKIFYYKSEEKLRIFYYKKAVELISNG